MEQRSHPTRIAIVGCGNVGATYAYALLLNRLSSEIVLIDASRAKAEGEAMDLNHAMPFAHPTHIWAGDFADCAGAAITVLSAGAGQRPGETRLDMVVRNGEIWRQIIPQIMQHNPNGILLIWASGLFALSGGILLLPMILGSGWQAAGSIATAAKAIAIGSGLFLMFYDGFVMNHSAAIPFWNTQLLPLLILMYATLGGTTLTLTLGALGGYESREAAWLEKAEPFLLIANSVLLCLYLLRMSRWTPAAQETVRMWVKGRYARVFFGLIVAVGLIATLMLSFVQQQWQARGLSLVVAGCELTGDFSLLVLMLKSGLFSPQTARAFGARD